MQKVKTFLNRNEKSLFLLLFLIIPVTLSIIFVIYPVLSLIQYSFVKWDGVSKVKEFVGFSNYYQTLFRMPEVWLSMRNNALYFIAHGILIPIQLFTAVLLNNKLLRGRTFFKSITFMPYIINGVAIAFTFSYFFSSQNGALNGILEILGMEAIKQRWLSDPAVVNFTLVFVSMWKFFGFGVILYIAALQSIPKEYVEAAQIDGANSPNIFYHIYVPGVRRITEILLFLNIRGALTVFDIPFVMTGGGPAHASSTFTLLTMETAFNFRNYGMASSMGIILMILIIFINLFQQFVFKSKEDE